MGIQVPPDSTGKVVETNSPDGTTQRQVITVGDASVTATSKVQNADPASTDYGLTIRDVRGNGSLPTRVDPTGTTPQPITVSALPLPSGASTAAKQPALGTAGTASADVISIQGIASMTPVAVSGTVTANQGTIAGASVTLSTVNISASASGDNTLISAVAAKKIYVVAWNLSFSGTANAKFTDGAAGTVLAGLYYGVANSGAGQTISPDMQMNPPSPYLWVGSTNTALVLNLSAAIAVGGSITYFAI